MLEDSSLKNTPFQNNIIYIEKFDSYSVIIMKDNEQIVLDDSLNDLETILPSLIFYRIHRSYILNITEVVEFFYKKNNLFALLSNGKAVPVSRRRRKELLSKFSIIC